MDVITSNDYYFAYLRNTRKMTMVGHLNVLLLISFDKRVSFKHFPKICCWIWENKIQNKRWFNQHDLTLVGQQTMLEIEHSINSTYTDIIISENKSTITCSITATQNEIINEVHDFLLFILDTIVNRICTI